MDIGDYCCIQAYEDNLSWKQKCEINYKPRTKRKRRWSEVESSEEVAKRGAPSLLSAHKVRIIEFCEDFSEPVPSRYVYDETGENRVQVRSLTKPVNYLASTFNQTYPDSQICEKTFTKYMKVVKIYKKNVQISGQCEHCAFRKSLAIKLNKVLPYISTKFQI